VEWTHLAQALVSGAVLGSIWGLLGTGFGLIIGVTWRFHFAFAITIVAGPYLIVSLLTLAVPLYVAILAGILWSVVLGVGMEWFVYRPLVQRSPHLALLGVFVSALGMVIVGENLIRLIWGSEPQAIPTGYTVERVTIAGNVGLTTLDIVTLGAAATIIVGLWAYLRLNRYGRAIRAVQDNPDMACAVGVSPPLVFVVVFAIGSALSAIGGLLLAQRQSLLPESGLEPSFTALVVMFLAGVESSPLRFAAAGLVLGEIQSVAAIWIEVTWSPVIVFGILFVYIAITPWLEQRGHRPWFRIRRRPRIAPEGSV
jgi:branched-chain amino acid transport system permease protein